MEGRANSEQESGEINPLSLNDSKSLIGGKSPTREAWQGSNHSRSSAPKLVGPSDGSIFREGGSSHSRSRRRANPGSGSKESPRLDHSSSHSSASNTSSIHSIRRSLDSASGSTPQIPPAFREVERYGSMTETLRSPRASVTVQSTISSPDYNSGWVRNPAGPSILKNKAAKPPEKAMRRGSLGRPPRRSSLSVEAEVNKSSKYSLPPPPPPSRQPFVSPRTKRVIDRESGLEVNLMDVDELGGDKSDVQTYNSILRATADSSNPDAQKGLDILATMERNSVTPDETTWALIDKCSQIQDDSDDEHDDIDSGSEESISAQMDEEILSDNEDGDVMMRSLSIFSVADLKFGDSDEDSTEDTDGNGRIKKRSWQMEQDLSKLPPAFRSSIMSMVRRKSSRDSVKNKKTERNIPIPVNSSSHHSRNEPEVFPSIANRQKQWLASKSAADEKIAPPTKGKDHQGDPSNPEFLKHGEVMYMRPNGLGKSARVKQSQTEDDEDAISVTEEMDSMKDPSNRTSYTTLLSSIARSNRHDKANRAGKVLRRMKENGMEIDEMATQLLEECIRLVELGPERKPHEVEVTLEEDSPGPPQNDDDTIPVQAVKKRVRFAAVPQFRIIRRRRSIGSNERWDDPLTPPKRMSDNVDMTPFRFSSGMRDNRPSLPRRSDSMTSLLSTSTHSSHSDRSGSSSSSDTDEHSFSGVQKAHPFKLPFSDSPPAPDRKLPATTSDSATPVMPQRRARGAKGTSISNNSSVSPRKSNRRDLPSVPVRRVSNDEVMLTSPRPPLPPSAPMASPTSIPPAPIDYRTPSPQRPKLRRRRSISGTEKRANMPLTPPRRVSAPLDIFIAQNSLKQRSASPPRTSQTKLSPLATSASTDRGPSEIQKLPKPVRTQSPLRPRTAQPAQFPRPKGLPPKKADIAPRPPIPTGSLATEERKGKDSAPRLPTSVASPIVEERKGREPPVASAEEKKPSSTSSVASVAERKPSSTSSLVSIEEKKPSSNRSLASVEEKKPSSNRSISSNKSKPSKPSSKTWEGSHKPKKESTFIEHISPMVRHSEKLSDTWKTLEFNDRTRVKPSDSSTEDGSNHSRASRSSRSRRNTVSGSAIIQNKPKVKPSELPSWAQVRLRATTQGTIARKGGSVKSSSGVEGSRRPTANASYHGTRTIFQTSGEGSRRPMVNASDHGARTILQPSRFEASDPSTASVDIPPISPRKKSLPKAARRNSLPN